MATRILASLVVLLGSILPCLAQAPASLPAGPALRLTSTTNPNLFRVELRNPGPADLVLNLGIALANGLRQYPDAVRYTLTTPDGAVLHLQPAEPWVIEGRVDPLLVPLPADATFSFPIDLRKYVAPGEKIWQLELSPGRYTLQAQYTGRAVSRAETNLDMRGLALTPCWVGDVRAAPLVFTVPSSAGRIPGR